jgi:hypothetical protein
MARKLCAFVIEGKECRREMTENGSLIGARGFVCPLGHWAYQTETGSDVSFRRTFHSETWHFSQACSNWPNTNFSSINYISSEATICSECIAKGWAALPRMLMVSFLTISFFVDLASSE